MAIGLELWWVAGAEVGEGEYGKIASWSHLVRALKGGGGRTVHPERAVVCGAASLDWREAIPPTRTLGSGRRVAVWRGCAAVGLSGLELVCMALASGHAKFCCVVCDECQSLGADIECS